MKADTPLWGDRAVTNQGLMEGCQADRYLRYMVNPSACYERMLIPERDHTRHLLLLVGLNVTQPIIGLFLAGSSYRLDTTHTYLKTALLMQNTTNVLENTLHAARRLRDPFRVLMCRS